MKVYVGQTRSRKLVEQLREMGFGECTARGEFPPRRTPWFYDNGGFRDWKTGKTFNESKFLSDVPRLHLHSTPPDFMVVPDLVAQGEASLALSLCWLDRLRTPVRKFLAVQDGMGFDLGDELLVRFDGIFVGGSIEWKIATGHGWVTKAHQLGLPCHIGRVGTYTRVKWDWTTGCDSIDSSFPLWSRDNLRRFIEAYSAGVT
jgi:hypothetical protein